MILRYNKLIGTIYVDDNNLFDHVMSEIYREKKIILVYTFV